MADSVTKVAPARTRLSCLRMRAKDAAAGAEVEVREEEVDVLPEADMTEGADGVGYFTSCDSDVSVERA